MNAPHAVLAKVSRRLLPLLLPAYLVAYINRVNIGFAPTMQRDLGLSATVFGLGAGLFFLTYFVCEVPSNLMLEKLGARRWIARIIVTWGLLSMGLALVTGATSFMVLRCLLGAAEAGFFPGVILYITYWFPSAYRARITAWFMMAIPLSLAITGPVSNLIMASMSGLFGLEGWQWLFIMEGLPTVVLAFVVLRVLPDSPQDASWLTDDERSWLIEQLAAERTRIVTTQPPLGLLKALTDRRTAMLSFIYFANTTSSYGVSYFLPQIIRSMGADDRMANYLSSVPFLTGALGLVVFGELADRYQRHRRQTLIISFLVACAGLAGAAAVGPTYLAIPLIGLAAAGTYGGKAPFWPLPSLFLTGTAAAGGIALINSVGNLGGFVGPYMVGWTRDATGSYGWALALLAGLALAGAAASMRMKAGDTA